MLTESEIDSLAREILTRIITEISNWKNPILHDVDEMDSGELIPVYGGTSPDGDGSFRCEYMPLDAIRKIIRQCVVILESFTVELIDKESRDSRQVKPGELMHSEDRALVIRKAAEHASLIMIASFRARLQNTLEEAVRDSDLISQTILGSYMGEFLEEILEGAGKITGDITDDIEKAASRVAESKRELLRRHMKNLPHILAERRRGGSSPRIDVSDDTCQKMAEHYPRLLKHWKRVAKNRKNEKNWRGYAIVDEPSTPEDLLDRLEGLPQANGSENGDYPNIPSALAHEHSARLCGIKPDEYSLSTLKILRRRGDNLRGQMKPSD